MIFIDYWKVLVLNFSEMGNTVFYWAKKLMERWDLLITEKFLFWTFQRWEMRSFFEPKSWWKDDIYWLLKSSCFELFGDGKYGLFFSQKVDGKMIFTWSFWVFHDIPGLGKYSFSCSGYLFCQLNMLCAIFWGVRSFFNSFVSQCNDTISGAKSMIQPLTWWNHSLCCCSRNRFYRCNVFCTFGTKFWKITW